METPGGLFKRSSEKGVGLNQTPKHFQKAQVFYSMPLPIKLIARNNQDPFT